MLAVKRIKPLMNCNFGLSVHTRFLRKKKNIIGKVNTTVKKYRAQVICKIGSSVLKYLANPSIIGSIIHANKLKTIAFIYEKNLRAIKTIIGIVKKDKTVDTKIILAILSTFFFGEYIDPTRKFNIALGIAH
tara:strand:+ start:237 stop:632 length:396 start_codon:yes stop_codon:yes gene_type:complete